MSHLRTGADVQLTMADNSGILYIIACKVVKFVVVEIVSCVCGNTNLSQVEQKQNKENKQ